MRPSNKRLGGLLLLQDLSGNSLLFLGEFYDKAAANALQIVAIIIRMLLQGPFALGARKQIKQFFVQRHGFPLTRYCLAETPVPA